MLRAPFALRQRILALLTNPPIRSIDEPFIPERLLACVEMNTEQIKGGIQTRAELKCPGCGQTKLRISYAGALDGRVDCLEADARGALAVRGACPSCGDQILVFDAAVDGYDAVRARPGGERTPADGGTLQLLSCPDCGLDRFRARLTLTYPDDLPLELPGWPGAFRRIRLSLGCAACKHSLKRFVDRELG